jgi:predicted dehydrogenase
MVRFSLIGDGRIAQYHKESIGKIGKLVNIYDIRDQDYRIPKDFFEVDYVTICSPTDTHRDYIRMSLDRGCKVVVEKPAFLPWQPLIDDDRINVVLQLRYANLPEKADKVKVQFVRDAAYFETWKGDPKKTGGLLYNLFIHYIDLAIILNADFEGSVVSEGSQVRTIDGAEITNDYQPLYDKMYEGIIHDKGTKPVDLMYLYWQLQRHSEIYGYGKNGLGKTITIKKELL